MTSDDRNRCQSVKKLVRRGGDPARDEDVDEVRCDLRAGHSGLCEDGHGMTWRAAETSRAAESAARYVLGFVFDSSCRNVLMIYKNKPDWQKDKLNGLGGKIREGEAPDYAMYREFVEETGGCEVTPRFEPFGRLRGTGFEVWLFHARLRTEIPPGLQGVDAGEGDCQIVLLSDFPNWPVVPNARYLVPMARNHMLGLDRAKFLDVQETDLPDWAAERST